MYGTWWNSIFCLILKFMHCQVLLNGWLRIYKRQRREQELVTWFMLFFCVCIVFEQFYGLSFPLFINACLWCRWNMKLLKRLYMAWNLAFCLGTVSSWPILCVYLVPCETYLSILWGNSWRCSLTKTKQIWHLAELLQLPVNPNMVLIDLGLCQTRILCFFQNCTIQIRTRLYFDVDDLYSMFFHMKNGIQIERNWSFVTIAHSFRSVLNRVCNTDIMLTYLTAGWHL